MSYSRTQRLKELQATVDESYRIFSTIPGGHRAPRARQQRARLGNVECLRRHVRAKTTSVNALLMIRNGHKRLTSEGIILEFRDLFNDEDVENAERSLLLLSQNT